MFSITHTPFYVKATLCNILPQNTEPKVDPDTWIFIKRLFNGIKPEKLHHIDFFKLWVHCVERFISTVLSHLFANAV